MATKYDPTVIQQFADQLYERASRLVLTYAGLGFLLGGLVGAGFGASQIGGEVPLISGFVGAVLLAALFAVAAQSRAAALRLQAQTALCQVQIEWNSRR